MRIINLLLVVTGVIAAIFGLYYQTKARGHISKEKLGNLSDVSIVATGPMPPKEILDEKGLIYCKKFWISAAIFGTCILLVALLSFLNNIGVV